MSTAFSFIPSTNADTHSLVTQDEGEAHFNPQAAGSVGLVQPQSLMLPGKLALESGAILHDITVTYESYGQLSAERDNAILVCHALSGDAHAAGYHSAQDRRPGWWDTMIGPGKPFDTDRYFVLCSNVLGGCKGSTGPRSLNPATGRRYGGSFPIVTVGDMVTVQARLLDALGIERLAAVAGGSMGGMQALHWAVHYPQRVERALVLASCARLTAQAVAFNEVGRQAILGDPRWRNGEYHDDDPPSGGLAAARMIGHLTYLSAIGMEQRFARNLQNRSELSYSFEADFQVESYLRHQGHSFVQRFDATSYLYITRAIDYFDLQRGFPSLNAAFAQAHAEFFFLSIDTDWLYPSHQTDEMAEALRAVGATPSVLTIRSPHGHDAFLIEHERLADPIIAFLNGES